MDRTAMKSFLLLIGLGCMAFCGQTQQTPSAASPSFEVASIKPNNQVNALSLVWFGDLNKVTETNVTVASLIKFAYNLKDGELIGGPGWINSDRYDINAKVPDSYVDEFRKARDRAGEQSRIDQLRLMVRNLLSDRFGLVVSNHTKDIPVFVLKVGKNGPKLSSATDRFGLSSFSDGLTGYGLEIESLAGELSKRLSRRVVDETGLQGKYDFVLSWKSGSLAEAADLSDPLDVRIARALDEQLGLKLEVRKTSIPIVQVESIQRPSEN